MAQQQVEKNNDDNKSSTQGNDDAIFIQAKMKGNYPWIDYIEGSNMKSQQIYGFFGNDHFFAWGMSKYEWDDFNAGIMEMNQIFKMMNEFGPLNVKLIIKWRDQEYEKKDIKIDLNGKIYGMDVDDLTDTLIKECKHDESGDLKNIGEAKIMIVTVGVPAILKGDDGKIKYIEMATEVKLRDAHDILDNVNHKLYRKLEEIKKEIQQHKQRQNVDKLIDEAHIQLTVEAFEENDYKNNVALTITVNDMINMKHPLLHPNWYEAAKVPNPEEKEEQETPGNDNIPPPIIPSKSEAAVVNINNQQPRPEMNIPTAVPHAPFASPENIKKTSNDKEEMEEDENNESNKNDTVKLQSPRGSKRQKTADSMRITSMKYGDTLNEGNVEVIGSSLGSRLLQLFRAREEKRSAAPHIISGFNYFVATYNSLTCTVNSNNIHLYLFLQNRDHNKNHNDGNNSDDEEKKDDSPYKVRSTNPNIHITTIEPMNKRWKKNRELGFLIYDLVKMMLCSMACGVDGDRKRLSKEGYLRIRFIDDEEQFNNTCQLMRIMIRYPTLFKPLIKIIDITKPVDEWLKLSFVAYQPILQNEYKNKGTEEWSLKQSDLFNEKIVKVDLLDSKHDKQNYCLSMKLKRFRPDVLFEDDVLDWFMKATHPEDKVYPNS